MEEVGGPLKTYRVCIRPELAPHPISEPAGKHGLEIEEESDLKAVSRLHFRMRSSVERGGVSLELKLSVVTLDSCINRRH